MEYIKVASPAIVRISLLISCMTATEESGFYWLCPAPLQHHLRLMALNHPFSIHSTSFSKRVQTFGEIARTAFLKRSTISHPNWSGFPTFTESPILFSSFWGRGSITDPLNVDVSYNFVTYTPNCL